MEIYLSLVHNIHNKNNLGAIRDTRKFLMKALEREKNFTIRIFLNLLTAFDAAIEGNVNMWNIKTTMLSILEVMNIDPNIGLIMNVVLSKSFEYIWNFESLHVDNLKNLQPNLSFMLRSNSEIMDLSRDVKLREETI